MSLEPNPLSAIKDVVQHTAKANKDHQYALKVYTERLQAELEVVNKLLVLAEHSDDEDETDLGSIVVVPQSVRPQKLLADVPPEESPFREDSQKRFAYLQNTSKQPMKAAEMTALADAITSQNSRIQALQARLQSHPQLTQSSQYQKELEFDWDLVAQKIETSSSSDVKRTARECEIRWVGGIGPEINQSSWTPEETTKVRELVGNAVEGEVDWVDIATRLGTNRTPVNCMRNAIVRRIHTWDLDSDNRLLEAVKIYGIGSWHLVARMVSKDATPSQCQSRYMRSLDPALKHGSWSKDEDQQLRLAVETFSNSWMEVCSFVPNRSSEQCRDRWQETLNPAISRIPWTAEEDASLAAAVEKSGGGKWKEVSKIVGNSRTDNMCRNRYNTLAKTRGESSVMRSATPSEASIPSTSEGGQRDLSTAQDQFQGSATLRVQAQHTTSGAQGSIITFPSVETHITMSDQPPTPVPEQVAPSQANERSEKPTRKPRPKPRPRQKQLPDSTVHTANVGLSTPNQIHPDTSPETGGTQMDENQPRASKKARMNSSNEPVAGEDGTARVEPYNALVQPQVQDHEIVVPTTTSEVVPSQNVLQEAPIESAPKVSLSATTRATSTSRRGRKGTSEPVRKSGRLAEKAGSKGV